MSEQNCEHMIIDDLDVSDECLEGLKKSGFATVGELVFFLERNWGGRGSIVDPHPFFLLCIDDVVTQLKAIGCWPESLQKK